MKVFSCPQCSQPIFFENNRCLNCNSALGFNPLSFDFVPISHLAPYCANHARDVCNWIAPDAISDQYCLACSFNGMIPHYEDRINFEKWRQMELAKHRLIYQILTLKLPLIPKTKDPAFGLSFDFLVPDSSENRMTGHAKGVITILLDEGDSVHREQIRKQLSEPYRTLLGHFRHEIGHYYWMLLSDQADQMGFHEVFGDETINYAAALQNYYMSGAPQEWNLHFISKYASAHPWEDWAETWAHYMHLMDTLETAHYLGLSLESKYQVAFMNLQKAKNPYQTQSFREIFEEGVSLTCAGNSLNRSMGLPDIYPFVWSEAIYKKLEFIHQFVKSHQQNEWSN